MGYNYSQFPIKKTVYPVSYIRVWYDLSILQIEAKDVYVVYLHQIDVVAIYQRKAIILFQGTFLYWKGKR